MNQVVCTLLFALVFGATLTHSAGHAGGLSQRCLCRGKLPKAVKPRWIHEVELFLPSPSCSKTEIILTVIVKGKGKGKEVNRKLKMCLDPNERQGQRLLKGKRKLNKKQRKRGRKEKIKKFDDKGGY
ncbi:C-X-C motif chemokine 11 [Carassius auratus]|uniref:C-X-C motif chemokine 11 n=1 Tax=Carassius auratus TaxID=7957 RepID=A0A6P6K4C9_CARAU|nr:C-X-C motif chemokine 11-like [Carassius auratus]XP_052411523.1 C-X-C motif chemokine 11 [Carassius gibelio]